MERRSTRSGSIPHEGTDAQFWAAQPNPIQIERGHAEAVALARAATRTTTEAVTDGDVRGRVVNPRENTPLNGVQGTASTTTQAPEGIQQEQRRTQTTEGGASFSTGDISSEVNTTRQEGTCPPMNTQQPSGAITYYTTGTPTDAGTPEQPLTNSLDGYLGDGLEEVLQNSQVLQGSFTALLSDEGKAPNKPMPLAWIVPDTTNRTLEEIEERTIADFRSPGGGTGALVVLLPRLMQFYNTDKFTVDIDSGEAFAHTGAGWHPTGLRCQHHPFNLNILGGTIVQAGQRFRDEISSMEQTRVVSMSNTTDNWAKPPEIPPLGAPVMYITYPDVMPLETRKRYVKDRAQAGVTYIAEHSHTVTLKGENRYHPGMLDTRLNIIFGRAQAIKEKIDEALRMDDTHRRRRNMRELVAPTRFPDPTSMDRASDDEWLRWMRHEMYTLVEALDEEARAIQDDNNPFNGTAGGVFQPLPENEQNVTTTGADQGQTTPQNSDIQETTPERVVPVQTIRPTPQPQRETRRNTANTHVQTPLIHPTTMTDMTNEQNDEISSQEDVHRRRDRAEPIFTERVQSVTREQPSNQREYNQRRYEDRRPPVGARRQISYDRPNSEGRVQDWQDRSRVFNNTSYLQFPQQRRFNTGEDRTCNRCGMQGHIRRQCQLQVAYCTFCNATSHTTGACRARAAFVRDNPVSSSRHTSPNGPNTRSIPNEGQQAGMQQTANHTSQWTAEPGVESTQSAPSLPQQVVNHAQQMNGTVRATENQGVVQVRQARAPNAEISSQQREAIQPQLTNTNNAEISSYQPQYQENRARASNGQESRDTGTQSRQQGETETPTRTIQDVISPQLEAMQAQINAMQTQIAQHTQRINPYHQSTSVDPLTVVGTWHHTEQHPASGTQLMGPPQETQSTTHHIQPSIPNATTGRNSMVLNTSIPPPTIQAYPTNGMDNQTSLLRSVREITETMQQHIMLSGKQTEYNIGQNALLVKELIKSNDRRDLDHALAAIPTFMGTNKEECTEWLSRIKNVCSQTGRNFRQELVNKAGLTVQTFINSLNQRMGDQELSESIMQFFSNVPTVAHAVEELKKLQQGETEPIVSYNQKYRILVERVEACPVDKIKSMGAIEAYLGSLIEPIRKSIRGTLFWDTQYAPTTVGEAMRKAQDLHVKYYYTTGRKENIDSTKDTVVINEVGAYRDEISSSRYGGTRESTDYNKERPKGYQSQMWKSRGREVNRDEISSQRNPQHTALRNAYTQVLVNPIQLSDDEFAAWIGRIVDARRLRLEKKPRPYREYRKELKQPADEGTKLISKLKPASELNVEEITRQFKCTQEDVEEAVEMYNMDVDDHRML